MVFQAYAFNLVVVHEFFCGRIAFLIRASVLFRYGDAILCPREDCYALPRKV